MLRMVPLPHFMGEDEAGSGAFLPGDAGEGATRSVVEGVVLPPRRGCGDFGEQRQDMQLAVEIELLRLALSRADAVP
jgi:hypothetical protein